MERIEIVALSQVDDAARAQFYARAFPERGHLLSQHWRWWYRVGFLGIEPQVAVAGGVVIGQAGLIPTLIRVAGSVQPAQWYVDFAVLPEWQGKGVGQRLTEAWMQLGNTFITHCNDNSMRVFRKFGFAEHDDTVRYARPIHSRRLLAEHSSLAVRLAATVADPLPWAWAKASSLRAPSIEPIALEQVMNMFSESPTSASLVRDEAFARWRLCESPFRAQYAAFSLGGTHAVVRRFKYRGVRRVHLLWLAGDDPRALMRGVAKWSFDAGCDLIWAATNRADLDNPIRRALPFRKPFRFAYFSRDSTIFAELQRVRLAVQAIDSDTDSMYA